MPQTLSDKIEQAIQKAIRPIPIKKKNKDEWEQAIACLKIIREQLVDKVAKV